jgi:hypothetical protein
MLLTTAEWVAEAELLVGAREVWLVEVMLQDPSGVPAPLRMFTGHGTVVFDGVEWHGDNGLGAISSFDRASDGTPPQAQLSLQHLDPIVAAALTYPVQGAPLRILQGWLTVDGVLLSPLSLWEGICDVMTMRDVGTSISITLTATSLLDDLMRIKNFRVGPKQQRMIDSTDTSMDWVPSMDQTTVKFPKGEWFREHA